MSATNSTQTKRKKMDNRKKQEQNQEASVS